MLKYLKTGALASLPLFVVMFILYSLGSLLARIGGTVTHNWLSGLGLASLVIVVWFIISGSVVQHFNIKHPLAVLRDNFRVRKITMEIKKGGDLYPGVFFETYNSKSRKGGVVLSETRIPALDPEKIYCKVIEPRPVSLGWPIHILEKDALTFTGKPGWELIKEVFFLSILFEENGKDKLKEPE